MTLWPRPDMEVETDYIIAKYRPKPGGEQKDDFVAKGNGLPVDSFFDITLEGSFADDGTHGPAFVVTSFATTVRKTTGNVLGYLSSGIIKGVGPANAKKIVEHFGVDAIEILEKDPGRLREVSGIGEKVLEDITESFEENREISDLMLYVGQYYHDKSPISLNKARRIVKHFGGKALEVVKNDIYHLCEVDGFGFITVDKMAQRMEKPMNTLPRVKSAAEYVLGENRNQGHLCMEPEDFLSALMKNLNHKDVSFRFTEEALRPLANEALLSDKIAYSSRLIYLKKDYINEKGFAALMAERLYWDWQEQAAVRQPRLVDSGYRLSPEQEKAAVMALIRNTCIITGGPGTGKTTVIKVILESYKKMYDRKDGIVLCAPTGRAAKRLSEATGYPAFTAHKAFGLWSEDDKAKEDSGAAKKLNLVILDEVSMADMWLMFMIITRISPETKLILVGDPEQLPSVNPGNVLYELIQCGLVPLIQLRQVFRQAAGSSIAKNAQSISESSTDLIYDDDFIFLPAKNQQEAMVYLCALYQRAVGTLGRDKVQILTPVRKDGHACGVTNLNTVIQELMQGDPETGRKVFDRYFCVGDPVIQTRNANGIYNGEFGVVSEAGENVKVLFTGADADTDYDEESLRILELAYALTVHKSQGSEYPVIIFPVLKEHVFMLTRNLLYTAITRGKFRVVLVGNRWALNKAITTEDTSKRRTLLAQRIRIAYFRLEKEQNTQRYAEPPEWEREAS
jgi:exodeoxyribonuclease V alpha subunit